LKRKAVSEWLVEFGAMTGAKLNDRTFICTRLAPLVYHGTDPISDSSRQLFRLRVDGKPANNASERFLTD
jgi:hypothetical protein